MLVFVVLTTIIIIQCTQDDVVQSLQLQVSAKQAEHDSTQERLDSSDAMVGWMNVEVLQWT